MTNDPIGLSSLDPDNDPSAEERFAQDVMGRVRALPSVRFARWGILDEIAAVAPRALAAAIAVFIVSAGVLVHIEQMRSDAAPESVADAIGVPAALIYDPSAPTAGPSGRQPDAAGKP